ncbi:hypothetical protein AB9P05_11520 [Roseivirga sp. BDSF3-8]|uniref:hypothetical protein n=1 Tax=Roseivirga sp. BDSF3-8 TaxID=3241598 RepID=UPI0035318FF2
MECFQVHPGRPFAGKINKDDSVTVSRYRYTFFRFMPEIYTRWTLEEKHQQLYLKMNHQLTPFSTLGCALASVAIILSLMIGNVKVVLTGILIMLILAFFVKREM